ncbi:MAG: aminomethyl-transferring glycine dehydrogenase subunit GcvPA, partial [Clostridiales bacterium]|nr:aminomethyl-transferring glycine dehydrogenase subunit GcvPA [Clostridiales bacterium]
MGSYLPSTKQERQHMLESMGYTSIDQLYADVPDSVMLKEPLQIPAGISELELRQQMSDMAAKNKLFPVVLRGAGAYDHYIPAIVDSVTSREEFSTTYTPYQAEISQGVLQSIFEYQSMICELTGLDVSNASLYDGASAAAEAAMMCLDRRRNKVLVSAASHPDVVETVRTYCWGRNLEIHVVPEKDGHVDSDALRSLLDDKTACFYFAQPNFYGQLENAADLIDAVHGAGAKAIMGVNPISLGLLKTPGEYSADIAVGEGQPLGMPLSYGGPYLGFLAAKRELTRLLPGRVVGQTQDAQGRRAFVLTLQAREQHIRREKAGSNVCSNQALCAMMAAVYMAAMGPGGMRKAAELCYQKAHYFQQELCKLPGFRLVHQGSYFHEFLTTCPIDAKQLEKRLMERGILPGLVLDGNMLWCVTEKLTKDTLDAVIRTVKDVCTQ